MSSKKICLIVEDLAKIDAQRTRNLKQRTALIGFSKFVEGHGDETRCLAWASKYKLILAEKSISVMVNGLLNRPGIGRLSLPVDLGATDLMGEIDSKVYNVTNFFEADIPFGRHFFSEAQIVENMKNLFENVAKIQPSGLLKIHFTRARIVMACEMLGLPSDSGK